jgi:FtsP/CotA-like multicopper oxidase with cupredoxin domain
MRKSITRRDMLRASTAVALGAVVPCVIAPGSAAEGAAHRLTVAPATTPLVGKGHPPTAILGYGGATPGPVLRIRQGEPFEAIVENRLDEETTVHWHGIRLPNAMDGVPGLTQPPIRPGETFTYRFTPPDAGTFWYHPHADSLVQMGHGLAGAFIVEEPEPPTVDRELLWVIQDWRLDDGAQLVAGFGNRMEAGMAGRIGNTVTINGRLPDAARVRAGERVRLRILNAATARIVALAFARHHPMVVALDGQPCEPNPLPEGRLVLGPAMRADLILDMTGNPGHRYAIADDFYGDQLAYTLVDLAYDSAPPLRAHPLDAPLHLPANPLPQPDLAAAERHEIALQGGMMGGGMMGMGGATWAMNGVSMTGDGEAGMPPLLTLRRGVTCVLELRNETAWWHPMHLHGHSFRSLASRPMARFGATRCWYRRASGSQSPLSPTTRATGCCTATSWIIRSPA